MAGVGVDSAALLSKLQKLNQTQQSIESVAQFCIFYRGDAANVVKLWEQQFIASQQDQRLVLMYLANHILQESRRKGPEFVAPFMRVLPKAVRTMARAGGDAAKRTARLVAIWEERRVFAGQQIKALRDAAHNAPAGGVAQSAAQQPAGAPSSAAGGAQDEAAQQKLSLVEPLASYIMDASASHVRSQAEAAKTMQLLSAVRGGSGSRRRRQHQQSDRKGGGELDACAALRGTVCLSLLLYFVCVFSATGCSPLFCWCASAPPVAS